MSSRFSLRFQPPENGWLPMRLSRGSEELTVDVSCVYPESLGQLVAAAVHSLNERGTFEAVFLLEPHELVLEFAADLGRLTIRIYERAASSSANELLKVEGLSSLEFARGLWRALREVWLQAGREVWENHWPPGFPEASVDNLGRLVANG